jgi:hypothetical protein
MNSTGTKIKTQAYLKIHILLIGVKSLTGKTTLIKINQMLHNIKVWNQYNSTIKAIQVR